MVCANGLFFRSSPLRTVNLLEIGSLLSAYTSDTNVIPGIIIASKNIPKTESTFLLLRIVIAKTLD